MRPWIMMGFGGHGRVVADLIRANGNAIEGYCAPTEGVTNTDEFTPPYVGDDDALLRSYQSHEVYLANGLGSNGDNALRRKVFLRFQELGFEFPPLVHPSAIIASNVKLQPGAQVMAGTVLQTGVIVGCNTIVNTRVSVDHDGRIGDHGHVAPGCTLSGDVTIGDDAHLGTGCVVVQGIAIGDRAVVGAGATVLHNVADDTFVVGTPARSVCS